MGQHLPRRKKHTRSGDPERTSSLGTGQLTLVEHSLCPLDPKKSLVENLVHEASFQYTDGDARRRTGEARVICPNGLLATDEFYLWGLLGLTLGQPEPVAEFQATPHFCLRRLGIIDQRSKRGGRQYRQFTQAIERLSLLRYRNDSFYDPLRGEHRRVSFGLFSYSLPLDPLSSRAWQFAWDGIFFELARAAGGHFRFDLDTYRALDPAGRRLLLFVSKLFHRRTNVRLDLRRLAIDVLGFSHNVPMANLKAKIAKCCGRLAEIGVLSTMDFDRTAPGQFAMVLHRGASFGRRQKVSAAPATVDSPVFDILRAIELDDRTIHRLIRQYPALLLQQWADVTLAAKERNGLRFFHRSPQAFFIDNVRHAAAGRRTPPDWWHELRKSEQQRQQADRKGGLASAADVLRAVSEDLTPPLKEAIGSDAKRQT